MALWCPCPVGRVPFPHPNPPKSQPLCTLQSLRSSCPGLEITGGAGPRRGPSLPLQTMAVARVVLLLCLVVTPCVESARSRLDPRAEFVFDADVPAAPDTGAAAAAAAPATPQPAAQEPAPPPLQPLPVANVKNNLLSMDASGTYNALKSLASAASNNVQAHTQMEKLQRRKDVEVRKEHLAELFDTVGNKLFRRLGYWHDQPTGALPLTPAPSQSETEADTTATTTIDTDVQTPAAPPVSLPQENSPPETATTFTIPPSTQPDQPATQSTSEPDALLDHQLSAEEGVEGMSGLIDHSESPVQRPKGPKFQDLFDKAVVNMFHTVDHKLKEGVDEVWINPKSVLKNTIYFLRRENNHQGLVQTDAGTGVQVDTLAPEAGGYSTPEASAYSIDQYMMKVMMAILLFSVFITTMDPNYDPLGHDPKKSIRDKSTKLVDLDYIKDGAPEKDEDKKDAKKEKPSASGDAKESKGVDSGGTPRLTMPQIPAEPGPDQREKRFQDSFNMHPGWFIPLFIIVVVLFIILVQLKGIGGSVTELERGSGSSSSAYDISLQSASSSSGPAKDFIEPLAGGAASDYNSYDVSERSTSGSSTGSIAMSKAAGPIVSNSGKATPFGVSDQLTSGIVGNVMVGAMDSVSSGSGPQFLALSSETAGASYGDLLDSISSSGGSSLGSSQDQMFAGKESFKTASDGISLAAYGNAPAGESMESTPVNPGSLFESGSDFSIEYFGLGPDRK